MSLAIIVRLLTIGIYIISGLTIYISNILKYYSITSITLP
jgi:hypothetical protein